MPTSRSLIYGVNYRFDARHPIVMLNRNVADGSGTMKSERLEFPIIDRPAFDRHRKSRKPHDIERMLFSSASEDWVTWTAFRLLRNHVRDACWRNFVELAKADNSSLVLPPEWQRAPRIRLWKSIPSPYPYEQASRARMRNSGNPALVARSHDSKPVEGAIGKST